MGSYDSNSQISKSVCDSCEYVLYILFNLSPASQMSKSVCDSCEYVLYICGSVSASSSSLDVVYVVVLSLPPAPQ